jgi:hypothetical protein
MNQDRKQIIITLFMGVAFLMAVGAICYGAVTGKSIDVASVQIVGTIGGAFAAILTNRNTPTDPPVVVAKPEISVK